jgi:hypothetical protein
MESASTAGDSHDDHRERSLPGLTGRARSLGQRLWTGGHRAVRLESTSTGGGG